MKNLAYVLAIFTAAAGCGSAEPSKGESKVTVPVPSAAVPAVVTTPNKPAVATTTPAPAAPARSATTTSSGSGSGSGSASSGSSATSIGVTIAVAAGLAGLAVISKLIDGKKNTTDGGTADGGTTGGGTGGNDALTATNTGFACGTAENPDFYYTATQNWGGACADSTLFYCGSDGYLYYLDCSASGNICDLNQSISQFMCISPTPSCDGLTYQGSCSDDGSTVSWCDADGPHSNVACGDGASCEFGDNQLANCVTTPVTTPVNNCGDFTPSGTCGTNSDGSLADFYSSCRDNAVVQTNCGSGQVCTYVDSSGSQSSTQSAGSFAYCVTPSIWSSLF